MMINNVLGMRGSGHNISLIELLKMKATKLFFAKCSRIFNIYLGLLNLQIIYSIFDPFSNKVNLNQSYKFHNIFQR